MPGVSKRVRVLIIGALLFTLCAELGATDSTAIRAGQVLADIKVRGPAAVVKSLWEPAQKWGEVMKRISTGQQAWLDVAVALRPGTDAGASETLEDAVFLALKPSPVAVLRLLAGHPFDTVFVCSGNIADEYSEKEARRFIRDRIKILTGVSDPTVRAARDECVKRLRAALRDVAAEH
jgi:hypothetical protein